MMSNNFIESLIEESVDPELRRFHQTLVELHNREIAILDATPTKISSVKATSFLSTQATMFADSAIFLMEDKNQPLRVPAALLRTCLEAQARANYIIASTGAEREKLADEFIRLMDLGHDYYMKNVVARSADLLANPANILPRDAGYLPSIQGLYSKTNLSDLQNLKKQYKSLSLNWKYGKVVNREKFNDSEYLARSEAQRLQPSLDLTYIQCCAFVHADAATLRHENLLTKIGTTYTLIMCELIALLCFFAALEKPLVQELLLLKEQFFAFDVNERVLPKHLLNRQPPIL